MGVQDTGVYPHVVDRVDSSTLDRVVVGSDTTVLTVDNNSDEVIHNACVAIAKGVDYNDISLQIFEKTPCNNMNTEQQCKYNLVFDYSVSNDSGIIRFYAHLMKVGGEVDTDIDVPS
jgi:hypothetical protein